MMMRFVLALVLVGCNQIYGLDTTQVKVDAYVHDAPGCSGVPFASPRDLLVVQGVKLTEPAMRADGLELWVSYELSGPTQRLRRATRPDPSVLFTVRILYFPAVKSRGRGTRSSAAGPSPLPSAPWHPTHRTS